MITLIRDGIDHTSSYIRREDGQALSEFGLILGLIAVVALIALTAVGLAVSAELDVFAGAIGS
jgi:Flp pilus assembly pilin Flp